MSDTHDGSAVQEEATTTAGAAEPEDTLTSADYYFDSYGHYGIHEEMLKDTVRTRTYQNAVYQNAHLYKDKVVLDVGSGTGILSLFAAKAGAKHVYSVECSSIADKATQIVKDNNFADRVTVIKGKMEEITLPVDQVDVIISEWMGYFLFYESMLESVLWARDKYLRPGGLMVPDVTVLHICAIEDAEYKAEKIDFWDNVYGFNMSCLKKTAMMEPLVDTVAENQVVTEYSEVKAVDASTFTVAECAGFKETFTLTATRNDYIHALVAYFDVHFTSCHKALSFSTSPASKETHWKQTVMYLDQVLTVCEGEHLTGVLECVKNPRNPRDLDITLTVDFEGEHCSCHLNQKYTMR